MTDKPWLNKQCSTVHIQYLLNSLIQIISAQIENDTLYSLRSGIKSGLEENNIQAYQISLSSSCVLPLPKAGKKEGVALQAFEVLLKCLLNMF
jgi:hypothetical protein